MDDRGSVAETVPSKSGTLKILSGPVGLVPLIDRARIDFDVRVEPGRFAWSKVGIGDCAVDGSEIERVEQHGSAFVVVLATPGVGERVLTFGAASASEAAAWVDAMRSAAVPVPAAQPAAPAPDEPPDAAERPITVTYTSKGERHTESFALLVIACDPRLLEQVCDFRPEELAIFEKFRHFTFHTTLLEVNVDSGTWQDHAVIFAPTICDKMDGMVYAFRNETAKQFGIDTARGMKKNLVTVYQLLGVGQTWTADQFQTELEQNLRILPWWPFGRKSGQDYDIKTFVTTPYFDHFDIPDLRDGGPWALLDRQGERHTILAHASTCFESALHCWQYAGLLLARNEKVKQALPRDLAAPIVIVGAGVSGILFAHRLTAAGYVNVRLLERTDRYGGKTHTVYERGPYPDDDLPGADQEATVCELGTCYLSPAYDAMLEELAPYLVGNGRIDFATAANFRGVVTDGQFKPDFGAAGVMNFGDYVVAKAVAEQGLPYDALTRFEAEIALAVDLAHYGLLHHMYVGWKPPMPDRRPASLDGAFGGQTFSAFLHAHDLASLVGSLQYAYEVQGYGSLDEIAAYYGLLWITPPITWTVLIDSLPAFVTDLLGLEDRAKPAVTAFKLGWGDLWDQIVRKDGLDIALCAEVTEIRRS